LRCFAAHDRPLLELGAGLFLRSLVGYKTHTIGIVTRKVYLWKEGITAFGLTAMDHSPRSNSFRMLAFASMVVVCMFLWPSSLRAGHIAGVDVTYECINSCTLRVYFKAYRDCSSTITNISPINTLFVAADSGCTLPVRITPWLNASNVEVTPVCPGTPTGCNTPGAVINGFMEHYWVADYDFCAANCSTYTIYWETCCRNANITTLFQPAGVSTYVSTTVHPFLTPCNSAPVFNNPPVPLICQGQSYIFSQGVTDPDGDSLSYALGPCMRNDTTTVPYVVWASPVRPLGPNWLVTIDAGTGDLTIAPDPTGGNPGSIEIGVLCIYVQEWRGGQLINTIQRDLQLTVVPCAPNDPPTTLGIVNLTGGIQNSHFSASTCLGATMCFDFRVQDSDLGQIQTVWWNQSLAALGATFTLSSNPTIADTIIDIQPVIRFCWTPTVTGSFNFSVVMHDDACPIYGISQYNFQIDVGQISVSAIDSVIGCKVVALCALPQAINYPWQYSWTGTGGLSGNIGHLDSCLSHSYPASGNFPYTLLLEDAIGCTAVWRDMVVIPNNVMADAGPDINTCANQPVVIGILPQASPVLTYAWSPLFGLGNPNLPQPTVTLANNTQGPQQYQYVLSIQDTVTYCIDQDTMTLTVFPIPASPFNLQDSACQNQVVGLVYLGLNGIGANYNWTFVGGSPGTAVGQGPHQVQWSAPGPHEVTLTVEENGCTSPIERDTIFIRTNPVAQILPVADQCLVGNSFNFSNFGLFSSYVTHAWSFWPNAVPSTSTLQNPSGIVFGTPGPKWVTVTTTDNGCTSATDSLLVTVRPDPDALWSVQGGIQCFSSNSHHFVANAGNGATALYNWTFQNGNPAVSTDTLPVVSFLNPGAHQVSLTVTAFGCTSTHTATIMVYPEPIVTVGADTAFCEGEGGVQLEAVATVGTAPFYYTWSCSGICGIDSLYDDDPRVNPSGDTYYYVQVTDANGCTSNIDTVLVRVNAKPIVNAGADTWLCGMNSPCEVLLPSVSGTGPFTYQWFPSLGLNDSSLFNPCARPDTTQIYVLVATEVSTGCSSSYTTLDTNATVTVHVNPVPVADAGPDLHICEGGLAQLQGIGSGAGPAYTYEWTPFNGLSANDIPNPWVTPLATTQYSFVVWSNSCPSIADNVLVHVHTMPSVDAGWNREICLGESTLLDATAGGDSTALYSYQWSSSLGLNDPYLEDPIATPPSSVTYFVVATSNWGCVSAMDSVTVHLRPTPIAAAGADVTVCYGQPLQLQGAYVYGLTDSVLDPSQIHFGWSPGGQGMTDSTIADPTIHPIASGMYYLQVRHATCKTMDSVLVLVIPELGAGIMGDTAIICGGDSLQLSALGGFGNATYVWSPASMVNDPHVASPIAYPDDTTQFTLILSESGCADTARYTVAVIPSPLATFLHSPATGCVPLTVSCLQTASSGIAYVWNFGDGSPVSNIAAPIHSYAQAGSYILQFTAIHTGGCASESMPLEVTVLPTVVPNVVAQPELPAILYLPAATVTLQETNAVLQGWTWDFGDGQQGIGSTVNHQYTQPGLYYITLQARNAEDCMAGDRIGPIEVRVPDLFIPNVFSPNGDGVNESYQIGYTGDQPYNLEIRDRWGDIVFKSTHKTQGWDGQLGGNAAPDGVYYYFLRIGDHDYAGSLSLLR
jgi:gliding motility-associated-like protein